MKSLKKNLPRAQTTRPASFGPVFVVPITYFNIRIYIFNKTLVSNQKYDEKIKKYPSDARRVVWARFRCPCPPGCIFCS